MTLYRSFAIALLALLPVFALAQESAFGSGSVDSDAPVEVESDSLEVNEADGTAEFIGSVVISQGDMRLSAPRVMVVYDEAGDRIAKMRASGGVTLVSGQDAAEAQSADYTIASGEVVMEGDVLLVQGNNTISGQRMVVNLETGRAQMAGRVRTILNPSKD